MCLSVGTYAPQLACGSQRTTLGICPACHLIWDSAFVSYCCVSQASWLWASRDSLVCLPSCGGNTRIACVYDWKTQNPGWDLWQSGAAESMLTVCPRFLSVHQLFSDELQCMQNCVQLQNILIYVFLRLHFFLDDKMIWSQGHNQGFNSSESSYQIFWIMNQWLLYHSFTWQPSPEIWRNDQKSIFSLRQPVTRELPASTIPSSWAGSSELTHGLRQNLKSLWAYFLFLYHAMIRHRGVDSSCLQQQWMAAWHQIHALCTQLI